MSSENEASAGRATAVATAAPSAPIRKPPQQLQTTTTPTADQVIVPPVNFSMVCPGVYRSSYPVKRNFSFLNALNLRSTLFLCPEEYSEHNVTFAAENDIRIFRFPMEGNKEPFVEIDEKRMNEVLACLVDTRNHPILVHCNKGKHRTGAVIGCLRKLQNWAMVSVFDEYTRHAGDKARQVDLQYIELFQPRLKLKVDALRYVADFVKMGGIVSLVTPEEEAAAAVAETKAAEEEAARKEKKKDKKKKGEDDDDDGGRKKDQDD